MSPLGPLGLTYRYTHKVPPCATYVRTYGLTKNLQDSGDYLTFLNAREKSERIRREVDPDRTRHRIEDPMTSPLLQAAAYAWLEQDQRRAHIRNPWITVAAIDYLRDARENA